MLNILIPVGIGVGAYFLLRKKPAPQPPPQAVSGEFYVVSGPFPHDAPFHSHYTGQDVADRHVHSGYRPYRVPMAGFRRR